VIPTQSKPSGLEPQGPAGEVAQRVHSAAVVLAAIECGAWPTTVEVIDGVAALLEQASRWQMLSELGIAA
jgi:hypothetical protein